MIISENDIFAFVFSSEDISDEKRKFIADNIKTFNKEIDFYKNFYSSINGDFSSSNSILAGKFQSLLGRNVITLKPVSAEGKNTNCKVRFAAASSMEDTSSNATSFINEENKLLVRVIKSNGKLKIYFNAAKDYKYTDAELKFLPSNLTFKITDDCLEVEGIPEITEIQIIN